MITLAISVAGERVGQLNVPESITASSVKTIKVASALAFTASASHTSGLFVNTGPVPPVANVPTTYSVTWQVGNAGNDIADGVITATLPTYITFTGLTSPSDSSFSYDPSSRTVTWRVGDVRAGTTRQGAFQVILTPSISQKGGRPTLTSAPVFSGFDRFVQSPVTIVGTAVTTETKADPGYMPGDAVVQ